MGSIITWYRIPLTPAHCLCTMASTTGLSRDSRQRLVLWIRENDWIDLGSFLFWPGFHISYAFMEVNENPGGKVQLRTDLFASDLLEQQGAIRNSNNY